MNPLKTRILPLAACLTLLMGSGCATPHLWKQTAARDWCPQWPPGQFLLTTTTGRQAVVVVFQQYAVIEQKTVCRPVAWDLGRPATDLTIGRRALRRLTNACNTVHPMAVFTPDSLPADASSAAPGYVVRIDSAREFTVYLDDRLPQPLQLPGAHEDCRKLLRAALTPVAVATDAAIVGAVVAGACVAGVGSVGISGF